MIPPNTPPHTPQGDQPSQPPRPPQPPQGHQPPPPPAGYRPSPGYQPPQGFQPPQPPQPYSDAQPAQPCQESQPSEPPPAKQVSQSLQSFRNARSSLPDFSLKNLSNSQSKPSPAAAISKLFDKSQEEYPLTPLDLLKLAGRNLFAGLPGWGGFLFGLISYYFEENYSSTIFVVPVIHIRWTTVFMVGGILYALFYLLAPYIAAILSDNPRKTLYEIAHDISDDDGSEKEEK